MVGNLRYESQKYYNMKKIFSQYLTIEELSEICQKNGFGNGLNTYYRLVNGKVKNPNEKHQKLIKALFVATEKKLKRALNELEKLNKEIAINLPLD